MPEVYFKKNKERTVNLLASYHIFTTNTSYFWNDTSGTGMRTLVEQTTWSTNQEHSACNTEIALMRQLLRLMTIQCRIVMAASLRCSQQGCQGCSVAELEAA